MSHGVPVYGVWNNSNAENIGFTGKFDRVRQVRSNKSSVDHIRTQQETDTNPQLPKRSAISSGIREGTRNESEIWETQSARSATEDLIIPQTRKNQRPPPVPTERRHELPPTKPHNGIGGVVKNEKLEFRVRYGKGEIWETHSAGDPCENFVLQNRQSRNPPVSIERRHEFSRTRQPDIIGERARNEKSKFPVGYGRDEIWETQSDRGPLENFVPQVRHGQRPTVPNDRRRHDLSPAKPQNILTGQDDLRCRHEKPRTGTSSGSSSALKIPSEAQNNRLPSSSSNGSRFGLLSSREDEFMAKERNAMSHKPKGPTAPPYGRWNVNPNCSQQYTVEFAEVRKQKENRTVKPLENLTPAPPAPAPPQMQQTYYMHTRQQEKRKGKKTSCFDFLFPREKRFNTRHEEADQKF